MTSPIPKPTLTPISALVTLGNTHTQIDNRTVATLRPREYDCVMKALERQTPMKAIKGTGNYSDCYFCPVCNVVVSELYVQVRCSYCLNCGRELEYEKEGE